MMSLLVIGEEYAYDFPAVLAFRKVQAELAGTLLAFVQEDEIGAHARDPSSHVDADVVEALGDLPARGEVVLLALDELVERSRHDRAVGTRKGDDDCGVKQGPPSIERRTRVEPDVIGDEPVYRGRG